MPRPVLYRLHRVSRSASPNCVPLYESFGVLRREHGGMFVRLGTIEDFYARTLVKARE
jgi:hypothetical protein